MDLFSVVSLEEAKQIINNLELYELGHEYVSIDEAVGRICSVDIKAECNVPEFRRSIVDGYAVISKDVCGSSESMPMILELKDEVLMGEEPRTNITEGECMYVPTGGMIPDNADSVVMVEHTQMMDDKSILIYSPTTFGGNIVQVGEDLSINEIIMKKGKKLRPYEIGVLASLGVSKVPVFKKPKVAIISTGDEITPIDAKPNLGQVRDINSYLLWSLLIEDDVIPIRYGIIKDDYNSLKETVNCALEQCDLVLISGGSSVGRKDQTLKVISSYENGEVLIHGIAVKPGKPTIVGRNGKKIIFGLPGHPLACAVIYRILVSNYIGKLMNYDVKKYGIKAEMSINYHKAQGREECLPVKIQEEENKIIAIPIFGKSGIMSVFSKAWGYIKIGKDVEGLMKGQIVEVYRM